ncbi:MAG: ribonuclease P protein component [Paludibacteraceae bacterium]
MHTVDYTFTPTEHLKSRTAINELLNTNHGFMVYPFRVVYQVVTTEHSSSVVQVMFVVRKRRFRHATDRNRFKRLLREAYRLHKQPLLDYVTAQGIGLRIAFVGISSALPAFADVQDKMRDAINELCRTCV